MAQAILKKYYGIDAEHSFFDGKLVRYEANGNLYTLVPVTGIPENVLVELYEMSHHLVTNGDRYASAFYPSKEQKFLVTDEEYDYVLLENRYKKAFGNMRTGRKLAKFHLRGRTIPANITETNRMGEWKKYWEQRLEQMEQAWYRTVEEHPDHPFEQMFVESFPYYMGLCENAIQYVVDTELDEQSAENDAGTICHERFSDGVWGRKYIIHHPFDWVFDHAARDIAEWIRWQYLQKQHTYRPDVRAFLRQYESLAPLSPFAWRLVYARLLFPLHYFECVEAYFLSRSEKEQKMHEEKLERILRGTGQYEAFLAEFYELAEVPARKYNIPRIAWLKS
ncbi:endospore coat-associated protein YutH [Weizmannia acidilactici]|uniref:Endospore coat-associated protein YutH n=1 Tax=Weizmannia acidilactici TaxID=2607726 RepID=A0A5J4JJ33_9BACI|nr:spore coat protein YutH [Weizmannia acidilactici]GER68213.1 endospore coat-associated protein YutH [Weizmannia acidilactici]GER70560.1 endospore coat-associated protein YutH [Weizmannia acidilactici]GER73153.1 endospore coat-associated protein YutH [Weizmannia acidilactici]